MGALPDIDLGLLTIPVFATIFVTGWMAAIKFVADPIKDQLVEYKERLTVLEADRAAELAALRADMRKAGFNA